MSHVLIFGMTESGKTTLAKRLAKRYKDNDVPVIVLDSLNDPEWNADFQTTRPDEFLRVFWSSKRCVCFIDEAGDAVGRFNTVMQRTATRGRHWGHSVHYITQRGAMLSPTVRDQCGEIFLLTSSEKDGKIHADEWNAPILRTCNALRKGNYFHATRFGTIRYGSLFGVPQNGSNTDIRDGGRYVQPGQTEEESGAPQGDEASGGSDDTGDESSAGDPNHGSETGAVGV